MTTAILYRSLSGVPGDVTRPDLTMVESGIAAAGLAFGDACTAEGGGIVPFPEAGGSGDAYGIVARVAPSISAGSEALIPSGSPVANSIVGVVVTGYVNVTCQDGTPVRGGVVYVQSVADGVNLPPGRLSATGNGDRVTLGGARWAVDGKDANNVSEIRIDVASAIVA